MAQDHSIKGERYWDCDLCGMTYRYSDTQLNSAGLRVCKDHDVDKSDYRYAVPFPYDINAPVYYDKVLDKYFQLSAINGMLFGIEIVHLGGWIPEEYTVVDVDGLAAYTLMFENGKFYIQETADNLNKIPLLVDVVAGETYQMIAKRISTQLGESLQFLEV